MSDRSNRPIVLAYDGSSAADAALASASRLFAGRPAVVATVWNSIVPVTPAGLAAVPPAVTPEACEKLDDAARQDATRLAEAACEVLRAGGLECSPHVLRCRGTTWSTIVDFAEESAAAVVVVGSRGMSPIKSALLGSVSSGVVHHCTRPVLVVHGS